jgi:hypothetical protein
MAGKSATAAAKTSGPQHVVEDDVRERIGRGVLLGRHVEIAAQAVEIDELQVGHGRMMPRGRRAPAPVARDTLLPNSSEGDPGCSTPIDSSTDPAAAAGRRQPGDPGSACSSSPTTRRDPAAHAVRLPESFAENVDHVLVCDDASTDDTYAVGLAIKEARRPAVTVVRHERNLGYGGNQKAGYAWAIAHGLDIVGAAARGRQYAPERDRAARGPAGSSAPPMRSSARG